MKKQAHLVPSVHMERSLYLWQYGDFGLPVLVFPSAAGMAHEWERHGMVDVLAPLLNTGRIKLYCIESNVSEAWTKQETDPSWRLQRHIAYERFVYDELVPWIRADCHSPEIPLSCVGTSLGAMYAANAALKQPETFHYALCMSGRYEMRAFNPTESADMYFQNPLAYLPNLDGAALERVRRHTQLDLVCGRGPWEDGNWQETAKFAACLEAKGVPHRLDLWGRDIDHDWQYWKRQVKMYFGHRFG